MKNILLSIALLLGVIFTSCNSGSNNENRNAVSSNNNTATKRYIRYNALSSNPQAIKDMEDLRFAFDTMKKMDCSNPLSYYYQGGIQFVPNTVEPYDTLCPAYKKSPGDLKTGWDNCTHTGTGASSINFLLWHRMYTWHLEKIVRFLSKDPNFAMPYWGYCDITDSMTNRVLSEKLRLTNNNSLYEYSRFDSVNMGFPISWITAEQIGSITYSAHGLFGNHTFIGFSSSINDVPHGLMHDYIGAGNNNEAGSIYNPIYQSNAGGLMANVPSAGFDPVFWMHHSNIDRLWQQWTNVPNPQITLDQLQSNQWHYIFFNPDGTKVEYTMDSIYKIIYNLDYDYDDTKCGQAPGAEVKKEIHLLAAKPSDTIVSKKIGKALSNQKIKFTVENSNKKVAATLKSNNNVKDVLVKVTVSFKTQPHGIYKVFINLPDNGSLNPNSDYYAGAMTFFGATHVMPGMDMGMKTPSVFTKEFIFDLTDEFKNTGALDKDNFNVTIVGSDPKDVPLTVEKVEVIVN